MPDFMRGENPNKRWRALRSFRNKPGGQQDQQSLLQSWWETIESPLACCYDEKELYKKYRKRNSSIPHDDAQLVRQRF